MPSDTLHSFKARNKLKQCSASNCYKNRHDMTRFCLFHHEARTNYGHPHARHIEKREYLTQLEESALLIKTLSREEHPALAEALAEARDLVAPGSSGAVDPGKRQMRLNRELRRLAALDGQDWQPVIPHEVLTVALAVFLFYQDQPSAFPRNEMASPSLAYAISRAILNLRPLRGRYMASDKHDLTSVKHTYDLPVAALSAIGNRVMTRLLPFLVQCASANKRKRLILTYRKNRLVSPITAEALLREALPETDANDIIQKASVTT